MAAVAEHCVLLLRVTDLTQIHLVIRHFPVRDAFAVAFAVFEAAQILVARIFLNVGALSVAHVFDPVTVVRVACRVFHFTLALAPPQDEVAIVHDARAGDVLASSVVVALQELAAVVLAREAGLNRLRAGKGLDRVTPGLSPQVLDQAIGTGEQASSTELRASVSIVNTSPQRI